MGNGAKTQTKRDFHNWPKIEINSINKLFIDEKGKENAMT